MMKQGTLGSSGLSVSALGLRCVGMSTADGPADDAESIATIQRAIEAGNTLFVTAEVHGPFANELPLGRTLPGRRVDEVIATKFGFKSDDGPTTATCHAPAASLRHYLKDVSIAARAFGQALFAVQGRQFVAQEIRNANTISLRAKANGRRQLFWLAREQEAISPDLAAELRSIAARA